jgi:hypothetical protein
MSEKSQSICPISLSSNFITTQVKTINVALSGLEWMAASRSQGKKKQYDWGDSALERGHHSGNNHVTREKRPGFGSVSTRISQVFILT